jgi:hypothetical protein
MHVSTARLKSIAAMVALCAGATLATVATASPASATPTVPEGVYLNLTVLNSWHGGPYSTRQPAVDTTAGVVHLRGAIATASSNTNAHPFWLPAQFRPSGNVYVPVDMCNSTAGRLFIQPSGEVTVQTSYPWSDATCFTSLDGASFVINPIGGDALTPINGWHGAPFGTRAPVAYWTPEGVHLLGGLQTSGTNPLALVLPSSIAPTHNVYVPVDMCGGTTGRIEITPAGDVYVQYAGSWSYPQCFVSLDGATYWDYDAGLSSYGMNLVNGWTGGPFGTATPQWHWGAQMDSVRLDGAMATSGTNSLAITGAWKPSANVYVLADLCNAHTGRLLITPSGNVYVQSVDGWAYAQCFTSLDGLSYATG